MNFNCDVTLWQNSRAAHKASNTTFEIGRYGSVWNKKTSERVAQFNNAVEAEDALREAGYRKVKGIWKP